VRHRPRGLRFRHGHRDARELCPDVQGPGERVGLRELGHEPCCHVTSTCTAAWGVVRRFWTHPRQQSMEAGEYFMTSPAYVRLSSARILTFAAPSLRGTTGTSARSGRLPPRRETHAAAPFTAADRAAPRPHQPRRRPTTTPEDQPCSITAGLAMLHHRGTGHAPSPRDWPCSITAGLAMLRHERGLRSPACRGRAAICGVHNAHADDRRRPRHRRQP